MEEEKTKDVLFKELQEVAGRMISIKETIEGMLNELEEMQKKYEEITEQIKK